MNSYLTNIFIPITDMLKLSNYRLIKIFTSLITISTLIYLLSSIFYFLWTLYQILYSFPSVLNYINKYLSNLFGSYYIYYTYFLENWNNFLIRADYFIKISTY